MLIGYMRVSKADGSQVLDLQRDALVAAGIPMNLRSQLGQSSFNLLQMSVAERNLFCDTICDAPCSSAMHGY